jgi:hypothetical protein
LQKTGWGIYLEINYHFMSHDFKPEPHEKAMIDVMLKGNTTPKWIYDFNKFLIEERTTGEIIKFIDELLHQELQKARETWLREEIAKLEGMKRDCCAGIGPCDEICRATNEGNHIIQTIIDRYQSELDQPIS